MKPEVLTTLMAARILFDKAQELCLIEDKYTASAGLVVLQDALELVIQASLVELDCDKHVSLDKLSFDQLLGELKKAGFPATKSGTLKVLNKQRVIIKHFGQLAEPATVQHLYQTAVSSTADLLQRVIGASLYDISLHELVVNPEVQQCISAAQSNIESGAFMDSLIEIRKALFLTIENDYSIEGWKDHESTDVAVHFFLNFRNGGENAPWYTKNKKWIMDNVKDPFDYVQTDHERIRLDLLEWGISTQDFWNIVRLTPSVFKSRAPDSPWIVKDDLMHRSAANEENARYCFDRALSLILRKQQYIASSRSLNFNLLDHQLMIRMKASQPLYEKSSFRSRMISTLEKDQTYWAESIVCGLDGVEKFVKISHLQSEEPKYITGYVLYDTCAILDEEARNQEIAKLKEVFAKRIPN